MRLIKICSPILNRPKLQKLVFQRKLRIFAPALFKNTERGDASPLFLSRMITKELVRQLAEERIKERDERIFIVSLTISSSMVIRLEIDKTEGNVSIEDCMSVSRNVEHNLDREEVDFELHVSSAGLDKPLRVHAQYVKNIGRGLDVILKDKRKTTGTLTEVTDKDILLEREEKQVVETTTATGTTKKKKELVVIQERITFNDINEARIIISFK